MTSPILDSTGRPMRLPGSPSNVVPIRARDGFVNVLTGAGTTRDTRAYNSYAFNRLTDQQIDAAYRGSWVMRKIIDKPATQMVREGRDWQADKDQIEKLEELEETLDLWNKVKAAEILRGLGGAGMVIWIDGDDQESPLEPDRVKAGSLKALHVWHRSRFTLGDPIEDWRDPWFNHPSHYEVILNGGGTSTPMRFHPSRVVAFRGQPVGGAIATGDWQDQFWGDSVVQGVMDAVQNVDDSQNGFAGLIKDARNRRIGIPNLTDTIATGDGEALMAARVAAFALGESMYGASFYDAGNDEGKGGEKIDDRQMVWAGIPDIAAMYLAAAAGAADMPATVLLGKSPDGMNATGKSDRETWHDTLKDRQDLQMKPCLKQLDAAFIPSALGKADPAIWWKFAPLSTPTEKEDTETFKTFTTAVRELQAAAIMPDEALAEAAQNTIIERGWLVGVDTALDKIPETERYSGPPEPTPEELDTDPSALQGGQRPKRKVAANDAAAWLADAAPRPLYVQRKLMNAADLIAWAKGNGFESTLAGSDMHVTVLYSRNPVDPMKMGRAWNEDEKGHIIVRPGGPRVVERLGENAVVLRFAAPDLEWRHREMVEAGGSHDYAEYAPHVTISYAVPSDIDLDAIKPFNGELRFGPEIFEALDLDWKSKVVEDEQRRPFGDAKRRRGRSSPATRTNHFDPTQPRGLNGRWIPYRVRSLIDEAGRGHSGARRVELGKVGASARDRLASLGLSGERKVVVVDGSHARHILIRHGAETSKRHVSVAGGDIASAASMLNQAKAMRIGIPAANGNAQIITATKTTKGTVYAVFEHSRKRLSLVTMWIRRG